MIQVLTAEISTTGRFCWNCLTGTAWIVNSGREQVRADPLHSAPGLDPHRRLTNQNVNHVEPMRSFQTNAAGACAKAEHRFS
jgi:hypothetical protein